jgi:hypothetical protein
VDGLQFGTTWWGALTATLWIARWNKSKAPKPTVVVEMRGGRFASGGIVPGDWVQLPKDYDRTKRLRSLVNLSRAMRVEMKGKTVNPHRLDLVMPLFPG